MSFDHVAVHGTGFQTNWDSMNTHPDPFSASALTASARYPSFAHYQTQPDFLCRLPCWVAAEQIASTACGHTRAFLGSYQFPRLQPQYLSPPSLGESASFVTAMHLHTFMVRYLCGFPLFIGAHGSLFLIRGCLRNREASDGQGLIPNWGEVDMKAQLPLIHWHDQLTPGAYYDRTTQCQFCLVGRDRAPQWINPVRIHAFTPPKVVLPHCSCCSAVEDILLYSSRLGSRSRAPGVEPKTAQNGTESASIELDGEKRLQD